MFLQQVFNGLAQGSTYALIAVGFALIIGTLRLVSFCHGEIFMMGAYVAFTVVSRWQGSLLAAFVVAFAAAALLGALVEFVGFRLLRGASRISSLLVTIGFSTIFLNAAQLIWGAQTQSFPTDIDSAFEFMGIRFTFIQIVVYAVTICMFILLHLLLGKTKLGRAIRATALDHEAAFVMGVDVNRIYSFTYALGSALGGLAGVLVGLYYNAVYPAMGGMMGLKAFSACILGGLTSIPGAVVAGFFLGEIENLAVAYISSGFRHVFSFAILIFFLIFRPRGLFGRKDSIR
ncbi:MAG: branched-chain amino acid ABC transporter permease [Spirochaetia bacterium]|jgi:branched-chain amino acid transport system permease protein|nr:branched-chain amino acid ABC transporter permease [Spirochaetia bacterium]